ncbi:hypothetical protein RIF29_30441 [Crotalaria pallida]|uniref:Uncharacterized protein n=1 Tax=Crotalaria pallida TaxID=3830 RepID=A0AAN9HY92_CROPI
MAAEITEEETDKEEEYHWFINTEYQKEKIRKIIQHQKSLYWSSSSSMSTSAASCSSLSSSHRTSISLLKLMKKGSTSLRRLFDMEHTSLATHLDYYSGSPIIKPITLWDSDSEHEYQDPWALIKKIRSNPFSSTNRDSELASNGSKGSYIDGDLVHNKNDKIGRLKLTRKKSYRRLPGFGLWICGRFRFSLRLRKLRVRIFGRKFR